MEIFACKERRVPSAGYRVVAGEVRKTMTGSLSTSGVLAA